MNISGFAAWLFIFFALIGMFCSGLMLCGFVLFFWLLRKDRREQKKLKAKIEEARKWEYDQMNQSLLCIFDQKATP